MDAFSDNGPVGKHGPYGTHMNLDGSPVQKREVCGFTDWRGVKCIDPATAHLCLPHMKALVACMDLPPGQVAKTPPSALQEEVERLNRVLAAQVVDSLLLSWVGTSRARMAAVVEAFGEGRVSLRRAVELTAARRPQIAASNVSTATTPVPDEDEADEPEGVGAGAPWTEVQPCSECGGFLFPNGEERHAPWCSRTPAPEPLPSDLMSRPCRCGHVRAAHWHGQAAPDAPVTVGRCCLCDCAAFVSDSVALAAREARDG